MGTRLLLLLHHQRSCVTLPASLNPNKLLNNSRPSAAGGPNWASKNAGPTSTRRRFGYDVEDDELCSDGDDEFGFGGAPKQRVWWFDDDDDDNWDVDDDEDEFWIFKVFRAFGWMFPAIAISLLLGTGQNAFFMALAVPLGQTAVSLVIDRVWGSTSSRPRAPPRTKTREKPVGRAASRGTKTSKRKEENKMGNKSRSYQSWVATDDGSSTKGNERELRFGGWDELDGVGHRSPKQTPRQTAEGEPKQQNNSKLSRTRRIRDKPLLLRLLIAVFPFLGSWTRFLF